jgi:hypothetical protein
MKSRLRLMMVLAALGALMLAAANSTVSAERSKGGANRVVGLRFNEPKQIEFLKAVLKSMKLSYTVKTTSQGELVEWVSSDPEQEREIQNRVSQFWFISTQCSGLQSPSPSQPARANLSC